MQYQCNSSIKWGGTGISIIIPVYKAEPYIKKCVESAQNQSFTDLQIIVVNDGTPDNSMQIVDDLCTNDNRIEIINKENGGVSSARNIGIERARGKYVLFLDSDDYLSPSACEYLWNCAEKARADVVRSLIVKEYEESDKESVICVAENINEPFSKILYFQGLFIRRDVIINNGIYFPPFKLAEDICFDYEVHINCKKLEVLNEITYHWVQYTVPFNRHKYDDYKSRVDMLRACEYLISRMLECDSDKYDSAVIGFIDHFFVHEYDAHSSFTKDILLEYIGDLEKILGNIKTSYRVPGLYKIKFNDLYRNVKRHLTYLKIFKVNWFYLVYFKLKYRGLLSKRQIFLRIF